jgi:hypothetical protein
MTLSDPSWSVPSRRPAARLVVGAALQACQAAVWLAGGLFIGLDDATGRHGDPAAVVLLIAAILVFAIGGFGFALAAGAMRGSDECRIAGVVLQVVSGLLFVPGLLDAVRSHGAAALTIALDPAAHVVLPLTPELAVAMPASCVIIAVLLSSRRSSWAASTITTAETNRLTRANQSRLG